MSHILDHPQSRELEVISGIIDANPINIRAYSARSEQGRKSVAQRPGAKGMSAEQVLRSIEDTLGGKVDTQSHL